MKGLRIFASRFGLFCIIGLLLAALSSAVLADADSPPSGTPSSHLLIVPDSAEAVVALARTDARVVARYESFSLVEAAGADDERLRSAGADRRDDMREVTTAAGEVDPLADRASLAAKRTPERDEVLALVQYVGPPKPAWVKRLRATGAHVVTYQPQNAYVVHARGDAVDRLAGLVGTDPAVRAVVGVTAADKVAGQADGRARYAVAGAGGGVRYRDLSAQDVGDLARDPGVVAIQRDVAPVPADERAAQIVAGNLNGVFQPISPGYLGWHDLRFPGPFDETIDVTDTGLDNGLSPSEHPDFHELGVPSGQDRVVYARDYSGDVDARDCSGHGTNVASNAAGYNSGTGAANEDAAQFNYGLGVAPLAKLGASKIFDCAGSDASFSPTTLTSDAYADGARISNNSWGSTGPAAWGEYTPRAQAYDGLVRTAGAEGMVEVFSAGNDGAQGHGAINTPGTAKNVITVGASEGVRPSGTDGCGYANSLADSARDVVGFSSRGPTDDGRLKPDLVAPGTHIVGARPLHVDYSGSDTCDATFTPVYSLISGTSQAAPQVAGAAALVRDWYERNVPGGVPPSPAMTKALLINSATDLTGGPNNDQGWGRVNVGSAFDDTQREFYDQLPGDLFAGSGPTVVRGFQVPDTSRPVKVTLVWTDPPGSLMEGDKLVNDLDLEVDAGGRAYHGNVFGGAWSRAGGAPDPRNNVESVYLPPGTSGRFGVTVRATAVTDDGVPGNGVPLDQDFALVVSNADEQAAPVLVHQATTVSGGDGDTALESDEQVSLSEAVRNAGNANATGLTAVLSSASSALAVTQASSTYPTIAEDDGVDDNDTAFAARLANAAVCGADVPATLAIDTGPEPQTLPVVLPTGALGPRQFNGSSQHVAIPDNGVATSSVFVPDRGRLKDVDVTITGIDHSSVGDLVVDLTGPDGTTVRLADHPGGPDNSGDDFTSTVFDDAAPASIGTGAPYTGSFKPQADQLSRFDGKSRRGTWTLRVRDQFAGNTGTLLGWGVATQKASCNVDTVAPATTIASAPAATTRSTSAQFSLASNDAGAAFECRLDGAAYAPCARTVAFSGLVLGTHRFDARAIDGSDNEDATPASYAWTIESEPPPPAASFVLAPAEQRLADALAGRATVVAACARACRASASLVVGSRGARRLGLGRRAVTLGSAARSRTSAGTAKLGLRLTRRARAALRKREVTKATVKVTLVEGSARLTFSRAVTLRSDGGLRRIAARGMRLWAACARACPLEARLTLSARGARRLALKPGGAARYRLASGRLSAGRTPRVLVLRVPRTARAKLARAKRVSALLEATAGATPSPVRSASLSTTLRR